jgi:hypothetical protein
LRKRHQWKALQFWERSLYIQLIFHLHFIWLVLRVTGFKRARHFAEKKFRHFADRPQMPALDFAQRCAELCTVAGRNGLYQANCLHQSLALCRVLRRYGLPAQLMVGVLPRLEPFRAHAWIELDGVPLGVPVDEYQPFDQLLR